MCKSAQGEVKMSIQNEFAIADIKSGQLNGLVKNLMRQMNIFDPCEAVRRINSGEWTVAIPAKKWREVDGVIHFIVTSDGTTGEQWITRLEKAGKKISKEAKYILRSPDFKPTSGVTTEIVVLKGMLFSDDNRITANIRAEADKRGLTVLNAEAACLIREMFMDQDLADMGLYWIVVMHEPINDSDGNPYLLYAFRYDDDSWLNTYYVNPGSRWFRGNGFAFAGVQVALNA